MQTNRKSVEVPIHTHGGGRAVPISNTQQLRRSVLSCLLWEDEFYEGGQAIGKRIAELVQQVPAHEVLQLAIEAREQQHLRHVPLMLVREVARRPSSRLAYALERVIQRADELSEFLAMYWKGGKTPISAQVRKGLAAAFCKFDEYQLAKYNRDRAITLRDVMFMVHPKPRDTAQAELWKRLADDKLVTPDTWEVALSGGADKRATFERMLSEGTLGYLALLRNLRNMIEAKVNPDLIKSAILARKGAHRVLPFRFFAAAKYAPRFEAELDTAMLATVAELPKLPGKTIVVIDVSGSMGVNVSAKSDLTRMDAAAAIGALMREVCETPVIYATAGNDTRRQHATIEVPARRGMALASAIRETRAKIGQGGIFLTQVMAHLQSIENLADRVVVFTDEQDCSGVSDAPSKCVMFAPRNYMINVASAKNGIGYQRWTHVDGFSENVIRWIHGYERMQAGWGMQQ